MVNYHGTLILLFLNYLFICPMLAEGTNVFPPDEEDVANVFNPLREMCDDRVVSNSHFVELFYKKNYGGENYC